MAVRGGISHFVFAAICILVIIINLDCGVSTYERPPARNSLFVSLPQDQDDFDSTSPQQVHISSVGNDKMRIHSQTFTAYNARWHMPYAQSGSTSNLYYSFEVAGVHVIMLGSYTDFSPSSKQYKWLRSDLKKVDRNKTPWMIVRIHAPWYNSNVAHQGASESVDMKAAMGQLLYDARVDIVFAGHVHAYERFTRVYRDEAKNCGPVHITIGDGGNREGLATKYIDPQPKVSEFREASFGHGELEVVNATHALWSWHRNDDDEAVISDQVWLQSLVSYPAACKA